MSRLVLNLRQTAQDNDTTDLDNTHFSELEFASNPILGHIGAPLRTSSRVDEFVWPDSENAGAGAVQGVYRDSRDEVPVGDGERHSVVRLMKWMCI